MHATGSITLTGVPEGPLEPLHDQVRALQADLVAAEGAIGQALATLPDPARRSALNLLHYLALRRHDLRPLQESLSAAGLSSLGRAESHVLASVAAVRSLLDRDSSWRARDPVPAGAVTRSEARALLVARADALFGEPPARRQVRIMVTAPDEAATRYELVRELVSSGMDCMRINCAHGDPERWEKVIANLRAAERELGASCKLLMDLPGPRARTGALEPGPRVVRVRPERDALGRVTRAAELWITAQEEPAPPPSPAQAVLPLPAQFLDALASGDRLELRDARAARRSLVLGSAAPGGRWAGLTQTAYIATGTRLRLESARRPREFPRQTARVGPLEPIEQRIPLLAGDRLVLTRSQAPGSLAASGDPARIPCTPPEVLRQVVPGESIWFDEGRIGGVIESVNAEGATVRITSARAAGATLGPGKAINLPETRLRLPALTARDLEILPFVAAHADLVGYSFVRRASDVDDLARRLAELAPRRLGVILKIESAQAFQDLPELLLAALGSPPMGVMIARGDLAVETGFARLAEVQEEILWLCEAAHVPVVWATQVLENLAKSGRPSRAEVTDAAVAERAECVMLNKGPYIVDAVRALDSILERMAAHQEKKQSLLRELRVAERFLSRESRPMRTRRRG